MSSTEHPSPTRMLPCGKCTMMGFFVLCIGGKSVNFDVGKGKSGRY